MPLCRAVQIALHAGGSRGLKLLSFRLWGIEYHLPGQDYYALQPVPVTGPHGGLPLDAALSPSPCAATSVCFNS